VIKKITSLTVASVALGVSSMVSAAEYEVSVTNLTAGIHFTPLIVSAHPSSVSMFTTTQPASAELQAIAEGGDVAGMAQLLNSIGASVATGDGLLAPGATGTYTINSSSANSVLSVAGMLLPTNDGFVGLNSVALPTSPGATTRWLARAYDAGTEGNDEVVGGGAPGVAGFPAPPPVVASGTGTNASGIHVAAEGFVTVHRGVIGDLDANGGPSDINAAIHRWDGPVAAVSVRMLSGGGAQGPSAVADLNAVAYSASAVEIFWQAANSNDSIIVGYEVSRDGEVIGTFDAQSYFNEGLNPNTAYHYTVRAVDANGNVGEARDVTVSTR
jgi:hypothetical protein